jgi:hypothetical protein
MATVVVDAENVRRSLWPNLTAEELVAAARAWAAREGHGLRIVFDGPAPETADDLVGSGYADDAIVALVGELPPPVWVATSDRALRARVAAGAECVLGGGGFAREISAGA